MWSVNGDKGERTDKTNRGEEISAQSGRVGKFWYRRFREGPTELETHEQDPQGLWEMVCVAFCTPG